MRRQAATAAADGLTPPVTGILTSAGSRATPSNRVVGNAASRGSSERAARKSLIAVLGVHSSRSSSRGDTIRMAATTTSAVATTMTSTTVNEATAAASGCQQRRPRRPRHVGTGTGGVGENDGEGGEGGGAGGGRGSSGGSRINGTIVLGVAAAVGSGLSTALFLAAVATNAWDTVAFNFAAVNASISAAVSSPAYSSSAVAGSTNTTLMLRLAAVGGGTAGVVLLVSSVDGGSFVGVASADNASQAAVPACLLDMQGGLWSVCSRIDVNGERGERERGEEIQRLT